MLRCPGLAVRGGWLLPRFPCVTGLCLGFSCPVRGVAVGLLSFCPHEPQVCEGRACAAALVARPWVPSCRDPAPCSAHARAPPFWQPGWTSENEEQEVMGAVRATVHPPPELPGPRLACGVWAVAPTAPCDAWGTARGRALAL